MQHGLSSSTALLLILEEGSTLQNVEASFKFMWFVHMETSFDLDISELILVCIAHKDNFFATLEIFNQFCYDKCEVLFRSSDFCVLEIFDQFCYDKLEVGFRSSDFCIFVCLLDM
jgi:hypothetical protein